MKAQVLSGHHDRPLQHVLNGLSELAVVVVRHDRPRAMEIGSGA